MVPRDRPTQQSNRPRPARVRFSRYRFRAPAGRTLDPCKAFPCVISELRFATVVSGAYALAQSQNQSGPENSVPR